MRFESAFICEKCGKRFTIDLGPGKLCELRTAKNIAAFIGELAVMFARSCIECCEDGATPPWEPASHQTADTGYMQRVPCEDRSCRHPAHELPKAP
jgi:hypothetical protein